MRMQLQESTLGIEDFLMDCRMRGLREKTLQTYRQHLERCFQHSQNINEIVLELNQLKESTRNSYLRTLKAYLNWKGVEVPFKIKYVSSQKTTYTDAELLALLRKPTSHNFCENRNWLMIMLMVDTGLRSSDVRGLKEEDIDLVNSQIHMVNHKVCITQVIPFSKTLTLHLSRFLASKPKTEYVFTNQYGEKLSANAFKLAIRKYNLSRGVNKTSSHMFRHTFAKKFLMECNGNAFTLQKMLGHSSLNITKEYCQIYDKDLLEKYESPVEKLRPSRMRFSL